MHSSVCHTVRAYLVQLRKHGAVGSKTEFFAKINIKKMWHASGNFLQTGKRGGKWSPARASTSVATSHESEVATCQGGYKHRSCLHFPFP